MNGVCLRRARTKQWQEVTSKKSKLKTKKFAHESLVGVENNAGASPRKVVDVKEK